MAGVGIFFCAAVFFFAVLQCRIPRRFFSARTDEDDDDDDDDDDYDDEGGGNDGADW